MVALTPASTPTGGPPAYRTPSSAMPTFLEGLGTPLDLPTRIGPDARDATDLAANRTGDTVSGRRKAAVLRATRQLHDQLLELA